MNEIDQAIQGGLEALQLGDTSLALKHFSAAIDAVNPGGIDHQQSQAEALRRRGTLYFDLGRPYDAITDLTQSIELNSSIPQTLQTRALVRLALQNPTGAVTDLQAAIKLNEADPLSHQLAGTAQRRCTQIDAAIASFTRAARLYLDRGETEKSRQCLAQIDRLRPSPTVSSAAISSTTPVISKTQDTARITATTQNTPVIEPRVFYRQAIERAEAGDAAGALSDLEWALKNGGLDAEALCCRAAIYSTLGRFQDALADFNRVLKADDRSAMAYGGRGRARLRLGDVVGAVSDFERAIAIDPNDAALFVARGAAYRNLGNDSEAFADFERAIAIDANCGAAYLERGATYARQEELTKASADYQQAASLFCEQEAWDAYKAAIGKAAKLRQPLESIAQTIGQSQTQSEPQLKQKLLRLVGGHWEIAERLLAQCREEYPGLADEWYLRQVISEIEGNELS